jgi:hypothetical protein
MKQTYFYFRFVLFPHNVVYLPKLDRSSHSTDSKMEECIFQLLDEFFDKEQPFHSPTRTPYEKNPSVKRHRELCELLYKQSSPDSFELCSKLLDIVEWYRNGKNDAEFSNNNDIFSQDRNLESYVLKEKALENDITEKMMFVIQHRGFLWT